MGCCTSARKEKELSIEEKFKTANCMLRFHRYKDLDIVTIDGDTAIASHMYCAVMTFCNEKHVERRVESVEQLHYTYEVLWKKYAPKEHDVNCPAGLALKCQNKNE